MFIETIVIRLGTTALVLLLQGSAWAANDNERPQARPAAAALDPAGWGTAAFSPLEEPSNHGAAADFGTWTSALSEARLDVAGLLNGILHMGASACSSEATRLWAKGYGWEALKACRAALDKRGRKIDRIIAAYDSVGGSDSAWNGGIREASRRYQRLDELDGVRLPKGAQSLYGGQTAIPFGNERWLATSLVRPKEGFAFPINWPFGGFIVAHGPSGAPELFTSGLLLGRDGGIWITPQPAAGAASNRFYRIGEYMGEPIEDRPITFVLDPSWKLEAGWTREMGENLAFRADRLPPSSSTFPGIRSRVPDEVIENEETFRRTGVLHPPIVADWMREDAASRRAGKP